MPTQDTSQLKEKILFSLRKNGPSLPVHIAKEVGLSILFSSAFLSELVSDKKVKMSEMRVGSSPVYFLPGHEQSLERFSTHLKSKEKEAFLLLKERKFLKDEYQQPAIRVALRAIKDFAIPFKKENSFYWRYFTTPESELLIEEKKIIKTPEKDIGIAHTITTSPKPVSDEKEVIKTQTEEKEPKILNIFDKKKETKKPKLSKPAKQTKKKSLKKEEGFFNKVKELLSKKEIEILDIVDIKNMEITLKVNNKGKEELLIAYNKKKISDSDILKAYKKSQEIDLPYIILSLGDASKKTQKIIDASKTLSSIEKL
jgi:hypothetical protein